MSRRGTTTVTIHRTGIVTFWSSLHKVMTSCEPENIDPVDLRKMGAPDRDRLVKRFGLTKQGWLRSRQERGWSK